MNSILLSFKDNEQLIRIYAKSNCKKCNGKGVLNFGEYRTYCSCVLKNVKKINHG